MTTIVTRAGKGAPLTHLEVDTNFTNLNTDKAETAGPTFTGVVKIATGAAATPSLAFTGDLNTGIYSPGADQLAISTGGTGRLFVDASGNVGIGTTTAPGSNGKGIAIYDTDYPRLTFRNSVTGAANTDGTALLMVGSNFILANTENGYTSFETNGLERLRVTSDGNLLKQYGTALQSYTSGGSVSHMMSYGTWDGTPNLLVVGNTFDGIVFGTGGGAMTEKARITSDGKLGLGTSIPSYVLDVDALTSANALQLNSTNATYGVSANLKYNGTTIGGFGSAKGIDSTLALTDLGINSVANLDLCTNYARRVRIDSSGRVGIGTSSPTQALSVVGSIQLGATLAGGVSGTSYSILGNGATGGNASGGDVNVIAGAGSGSGVNGSVYISAGSAASPASVTTGGSVFITSGKPSDSLASGTIDFRYYAGNPSTLATAMRIDSSGRVGVGTTSPGFTVHANRSTAVDTFYGSQNSLALSLFGTDSAGGAVVYNGSAYPIQFSTNGTERARIDSSGRLLVGTSSTRTNVNNGTPITQIETAVASENTGLSIINNSSVGYTSRLVLGLTSGNSIGSTTAVSNNNILGYFSYVGADGTKLVEAARIEAAVDGTPGANDMPGRLVFSTTADGASSPTERMRIDSAGNMLMGASYPTGILSIGPVDGKTGIFGSASTAGQPGIQGAHTANSATGYVAYFANSGSATGLYISNTAAWQSTSDLRLKTDIQDLDTTSRLLSLKPRDYLWKSQATSDNSLKRNFGFIAQEVQEVFPELVGESPDGMLSVEYTGLIAPLVKAIQEQQAIITDLQAKVAALEAA